MTGPEAAARTWTPDERALWERIAAHPFESPGIALDFAGRLARTLGWSLDTARASIEEYRRFCWLAATGSEPVTPSEEIDEIWHLHLTYSRDYWEVWCTQVLRRSLHHDPTSGGPSERRRYHAQYVETLARYEAAFGPPPARFWPGLRDHFRERGRYRVVDSDCVLVLPRPRWRTARAAALPVIAAATAVASVEPAAALPDVLDWNGPNFLGMFFVLLVAAFAVAYGLRRLLCAGNSRMITPRNLSPVEIAYLKGGTTRAADTLAIALSTCAAATVTQIPPRIQVSMGRADLPRALQPFRSLGQGTFSRLQFIRLFARASATARMRLELVDAGLLVDRVRNTWCTLATFLIVVPVMALGLAKIFVGASRGKPVGFLFVMLVLAVIGLLLTAFRRRRLTRDGREALERTRLASDRAVRAPRRLEVPLAFAFVGAAALAGTEHTAYAAMLKSASSSGSGGCSSGGGDGGGGGGCGGCGGS